MVALFFSLNTPLLIVVLMAAAGASVGAGVALGGWLRHRHPHRQEGVGIIQGALFGLVGLLLAFGLSMSVGRYEDRRSAMVHETNAIGTVVLRAELLDEPHRSASLSLLPDYVEAVVRFSGVTPGTSQFEAANADIDVLFEQMWRVATQAMADDPVGNPPRLFIEALGVASDAHGVRVAGLGNQVPDEVAVLMLLASCAALAALGMHLSVVGRGLMSSVIAAAVVVAVLVVSFDLDRPYRGWITVPDAPLVQLRDSLTKGT